MPKSGRLTSTGFMVFAILVLATTSSAQTRPPVVEQLAKTYGLDSFGQVEAVRYTFNLQLSGLNLSHSWVWEPKTGKVSYEGKDKDGKPVKVTFVQSELNGESPVVKDRIDWFFVNDNYWMFLPFHVYWDSPGADVQDKGMQKLPLGKGSAQLIVMQYSKAESPRLFAVLGGLFSIYFNRGEYITASELARRMLALAERVGDDRLRLWAHYSIGFNLQAQGDCLPARFHLEQSVALYQPDKSDAYGWVQNPGPTGLGMLAHVLYTLGYPDQALRRAEEALAMARALGHSYTLTWVLGSIVGVLLRRGDYREAKEFAEERIALCTEHGFLSLLSEATVHYGFVLVQLGRSEEGVAQMRQGLEIDSRTGASQVRLLERYLSAQALAKIGRSTEGLAIIAALLAVFEQTSDNSNVKTDIYRLKGDLLLMEGPSHQAEAADNYHHAIELARRNSDRIAELEATTSLARLLNQQQRRDEAGAMLAAIYNWFTEGFDTADLKDAKALLDELATYPPAWGVCAV